MYVYVHVCVHVYYAFPLFPLMQKLNLLFFTHYLWIIFNNPIGI